MTEKKSRRQEAGNFASNGQLRQVLEMHAMRELSHDAIDLIVDVVIRYCEPRNAKRDGNAS